MHQLYKNNNNNNYYSNNNNTSYVLLYISNCCCCCCYSGYKWAQTITPTNNSNCRFFWNFFFLLMLLFCHHRPHPHLDAVDDVSEHLKRKREKLYQIQTEPNQTELNWWCHVISQKEKFLNVPKPNRQNGGGSNIK